MSRIKELSKDTKLLHDIEDYLQYVIKYQNKSNGQIYKDLCEFFKRPVSNQIHNGVKHDHLKMNLDLVRPNELEIFLMVLKFCQFKSIDFSDSVQGKKGAEEITQRLLSPIRNLNVPKSKPRTYSQEVPPGASKTRRQLYRNLNNFLHIRESQQLSNQSSQINLHFKNYKNDENEQVDSPIFRKNMILTKEKDLEPFLLATRFNMINNNKLVQIRFQGMIFSQKGLELIADGIKNTTHVKNLHIINCELKTKDMNILFESLKSNDSLILLDLSHNKLDQNIGMYIGQILSAHAKKRDEIIWLLSLRGEKPLEDLSLRGICEINLSYNQINCQSVKDLCAFLELDAWIKCINLQANMIQQDGLKEIIRILEINESIISMDVRKNPGCDQNLSRIIIGKLIGNLETLKKKKSLQPRSISSSETQKTYTMSELKSNLSTQKEQINKQHLSQNDYNELNNNQELFQVIQNLQEQNSTYRNEIECLKSELNNVNQQYNEIIKYLQSRNQITEESQN